MIGTSSDVAVYSAMGGSCQASPQPPPSHPSTHAGVATAQYAGAHSVAQSVIAKRKTAGA